MPVDFQILPTVRTITGVHVEKVLGSHVFNTPVAASNSSVPKITNHVHTHVSTRPISTTSQLFTKNDRNNASPSSPAGSVDEFRASEERSEQEYESQQSTSDSKGTIDKSSNEEEQQRVQEVRCRILDAALTHVVSLGWSREAIMAGAEQCGYPGVAHGMFPNGGAELVHHFYTKCNNQLIDQLKAEDKARAEGESPPIPTEFIARAIKLRLQMIEPYIDSWPKALAVMTLPQNVPTSLAQLLTLVDDICYYAGDRSVDVSSISIVQFETEN